VKRGANFIPAIFSAAVALIASLLAIAFTSDVGTLLCLVGVSILVVFVLVLGIALRRTRQQCIRSVVAFAVFLIVTSTLVISQYQVRPHLLWFAFSNRYKHEVLADPSPANGELKHVEWDGDGWGSGPTGDWMGYVVFDPSDSLSEATKNNVPTEYRGIPCKVLLVRRLEKHWYSVVLDMNQFWDKMHPAC